MIIIGITGTLGAGKGTIVEYLTGLRGFRHFSVRNLLIEEIERRGHAVNRDSMVAVANELRSKHSPAYMAEVLYQKALASGVNCVIESIRTPGEVELLRKKSDFYLFAVDAQPEIRYRRIIERASVTDHISFSTFLENEKREMLSEDPNHQNLSKCIGMADFLFTNDGTIDELFFKLGKVLDKIFNNHE